MEILCNSPILYTHRILFSSCQIIFRTDLNLLDFRFFLLCFLCFCAFHIEIIMYPRDRMRSEKGQILSWFSPLKLL